MRPTIQTSTLVIALCGAGNVAWALEPLYPFNARAVYTLPPPVSTVQAAPWPAYPQLAYARPWPPYPRHLGSMSVGAGRPAAVGAKAANNAAGPADPAPPSAAGSAPAAKAPPPESDGTTDSKAAFLARLRPLVEAENRRLRRLRSELGDLLAVLGHGGELDAEQRKRVKTLATRYRIDGDPLTQAAARSALLEKIDEVPVSLALAQAANESAWGTSRFAREGNNLFGIWTYDESKGMVPRRRAAGKKHLVRRFDSVAASMRYYLFTLNSHPAYAELRAIRARLRTAGSPLDGIALAAGLTRYSAKGGEYVRRIQAMIRRFDLAAFDAAGRESA